LFPLGGFPTLKDLMKFGLSQCMEQSVRFLDGDLQIATHLNV